MTAEEAATLLGLSRQSVYRAARLGRLPVVRLGKRLLFTRQGLERLLATGNGVDPVFEPRGNQAAGE